MKKTLFSLMAMCMMLVMASCGGKNNELEGTWVADAKNIMGDAGQMFEKCELLMTLDGNEMSMAVDMSGDIHKNGMNMSIGLKIEMDGTYSTQSEKEPKVDIDGNFTPASETLTMNFEKSTPKVDLYKFELDSQTKAVLEAAGLSEELLKETMLSALSPENFKKSIAAEGTTMIKQLDAATLILVNKTGQEITFTRK